MTRTRRAIVFAVVAAGLALLPRPAAAFHAGNVFDRPPGAGGSGGIFYAGAPLDRRWDCSTCHVDSPRKIKVRLRVDPADLFSTFRYVPERRYAFTATLEGEHRGLSSPRANFNGATFQTTTVAGLPAGTLSGPPDDFHEGGPSLLATAGQRVGVTSWAFDWTAPAAGAGQVWLHVAAVDGNGAEGGPNATLTDAFGDDVFVARVTFQEGSPATGSALERASGEDGASLSDDASSVDEAPSGNSGNESRTTTFVEVVGVLMTLSMIARRSKFGSVGAEGRMKPMLGRVNAAGLALLLGVACGSESKSTDPCPQGICGDNPGGSSNGGPNGSSSSGGGASGSSGRPGGCTPSWVCTPWKTSGGNQATRTCTDANACGTGQKPVEAADLPALDRPAFECNVFPVFQQKCSMLGCHGTEQDRALRIYSRGRLRILGATLPSNCSNPTIQSDRCVGSIECGCFTARHTDAEKQANFDSARGFALDENGALLADVTKSDLLAQPVFGGKAHAGIHLFKAGDADYEAIKSWLSGGKVAACNHPYN